MKLRELFPTCELNQIELAQQMGIKPAHLSHILNGRVRLRLFYAKCMAEILNVPVEQLYTLLPRNDSDPNTNYTITQL